MKLSDESILHIVKLLQIAVLSGTDIVDHFRQINFKLKEGETDLLDVSSESVEILEKTIQEMMAKVPEDVKE